MLKLNEKIIKDIYVEVLKNNRRIRITDGQWHILPEFPSLMDWWLREDGNWYLFPEKK